MCGRIALYDNPDHLARLLDAGVDPELLSEWRPAWNVAPTATSVLSPDPHNRWMTGQNGSD